MNLFEKAETALRYGDIVCIFQNDRFDKYYLVNYKGNCYEIEKSLGRITEVCEYKKSKPRYYDTQVNSKMNLI